MAEDQCSESLIEPTDLETDVYGRLHNMLRAAWKRRVSLRLVSLKLSTNLPKTKVNAPTQVRPGTIVLQ